MRTELQHILFDGAIEAGTQEHGWCKCAWCARNCLEHTTNQIKRDLKPSAAIKYSIADIMERIKGIQDAPRVPLIPGCSDHTPPNHRAIRAAKLNDLKLIDGLGLDLFSDMIMR